MRISSEDIIWTSCSLSLRVHGGLALDERGTGSFQCHDLYQNNKQWKHTGTQHCHRFVSPVSLLSRIWRTAVTTFGLSLTSISPLSAHPASPLWALIVHLQHVLTAHSFCGNFRFSSSQWLALTKSSIPPLGMQKDQRLPSQLPNPQ
jgi:hypothetical protein